jgi:hypothetical protein
MELEVAAKQQELLALEAENAQLKSRARVLETAQRCSTEIHELMKLLDGLQVRGVGAGLLLLAGLWEGTAACWGDDTHLAHVRW